MSTGSVKEIKRIVRKLLANGWTKEQGKHNKLRSPEGKLVSYSMSPSDGNAHRAFLRDIRRAHSDPNFKFDRL